MNGKHFTHTVSLVLSHGFTTLKPGRHRLHSLHTTSAIRVHGHNSNSLSWQREQGRHTFRREACEENVPSSHGMQLDDSFRGQDDEYPRGHF